MYERFTQSSRKVMELANEAARDLKHAQICTEHVLLGLILEGKGIAACAIRNNPSWITADNVIAGIEAIHATEPSITWEQDAKLPQTPRAKKVVEYACDESCALHHKYIGTEHLLLGLLRDNNCGAVRVLQNLGANPDHIKTDVLFLLGHGPEDAQQKQPSTDPDVHNMIIKIMETAGTDSPREALQQANDALRKERGKRVEQKSTEELLKSYKAVCRQHGLFSEQAGKFLAEHEQDPAFARIAIRIQKICHTGDFDLHRLLMSIALLGIDSSAVRQLLANNTLFEALRIPVEVLNTWFEIE